MDFVDIVEMYFYGQNSVFFKNSEMIRRLSYVLMVALWWSFTGCISTEHSAKAIRLDDPKSSGGILVKNPDSGEFDRIIDMLEGQGKPAVRSVAPSSSEPPLQRQIAAADTAESGSTQSQWPPGTGELYDLPKLNDLELTELLDDLILNFQANEGFQRAGEDIIRRVPALPDGIAKEEVLFKPVEEGIEVLRLGVWTYRARAPRLGIYSALLKPDEVLVANGNKDETPLLVKHALEAFDAMRQNLTYQDLDTQIVQLSYIDVPSALDALQGMGITTFKVSTAIPQDIQFEQLPVVVELPSPKPEDKGLVGKQGGEIARGQFGASLVPSVASELAPDMVASPTDRILVLFHPAHPGQFSRVKRILGEIIDRPARQIFVEAMVIEIAKGNFSELGVQWEFQDGKFDMLLGALSANLDDFNNLVSTATLNADSLNDLASQWKAKLRALVIEGKAEILSRPSILTLNNRQATIRVGRDIPIATSQEGIQSDSSKLSFDFKYLPLGILLNIRPRISDNDREISLMVDTVVSDEVPGGTLEIRDSDGQLLASAPRISTRRVQTYARIENNTPFIIGGLVSSDKTVIHEKVPFLGDLPLLGPLFRAESFQDTQDEVIIVLTPYILPERLHLSRALPKDNPLINDEDRELFRDSYRISQADIINVSFLYRNQRFKQYRKVALAAMDEDFTRAEQEPFYSFSKGRLPGEKVLVNHILYNTVKRLKLNERMGGEDIYILSGHSTGGYEMDYLYDILTKLGDGQDPLSFFELHPDKAIGLSFNDPLQAVSKQSLVSDPIPVVSVLDCPDRKRWLELMWEMNQSGDGDRDRYAVILHREEDLDRLMSALMVKFILQINGGGGPEASLLKFIPGRYIEIPELQEQHTYFLDAEAARFYYHTTQHYYAETISQIGVAIAMLDKQLQSGSLRHLKHLIPD
jgi:general secretion pathway protein D